MEPTEDVTNMTNFLDEIEKLNLMINNIKKKSQELEQFHSQALSSVSEEKEHPENLDRLMDQISADIQIIRNKIKAIEMQNLKLGADPSKSDLTAEQRMRISQHANIAKKFLDQVNEYQEVQKKYKQKYKERLERQMKIIKPNATQEEVDQIVESGGLSGNQLFAQQIIQGPQHAEAKKALYDIQERHQDIIKLEKSILELHQLFVDMSVLVNAQGDMLNQIENYVTKATEHTNKGVDEMKKAVKSQKKSRKKMYCLLCMLIIMIIIVPIIVTQQKKFL